MNTTEIIAVIAIVLIIGGAVAYIIKAKRNGQKCIGCPYSKQCGGKCNGAVVTTGQRDKKSSATIKTAKPAEPVNGK